MEKLLTINEAATQLNIPPKSVYRLIHIGSLQSTRLGKLFRIRQSDLCDFVNQLPIHTRQGGQSEK
jgi:excisionase family DNA binding protein